ncbi:MAG TPA: DapH/DapD/GlmU-related protein, partial [Burkholderiaceae bacterium]|nr:DapH/DapD/GlmU-related protein [Burkholderiaceae bacterium]
MTRVHRLWCALWPARWWRALRMLLAGVRFHPSAVLLGRAGQLNAGRGTVIGAHVQMDVGQQGVIELGRSVWLARDTEIQTSTNVQLGDGTTLQRRCTINGTVRLGRGCIVAPNVFISSGTHPFRLQPHLPIREQERLSDQQGNDRPIWIQDDCWLGVNAVICPGVVVGKGSVVGANAVVTEDVPPYSVAVGVPARASGCRLRWMPPRSIEAGRVHDMVYVLSG